jgi:cytochrome b561
MPIGGWVILSAEGETIPFFGWQLPALIAPNEMLAEQVEEIHELGSRVGYALIGLHAIGALVHHYLWRDGTLKRMWFSR